MTIPYFEDVSPTIKFYISLLSASIFVARSPASAIAVINDLKAKGKFEFIKKNFPDTDYAMDARFKLDLITDQLAAKEMLFKVNCSSESCPVLEKHVDMPRYTSDLTRIHSILNKQYYTTILLRHFCDNCA